MRLERISWPKAEEYFKHNDMVILPTGSVECHGRHVALGTDFDGITGEFEIGGPQDMALLADALHKAGFSEDQIGQIFFDNAARVIREGMN